MSWRVASIAASRAGMGTAITAWSTGEVVRSGAGDATRSACTGTGGNPTATTGSETTGTGGTGGNPTATTGSDTTGTGGTGGNPTATTGSDTTGTGGTGGNPTATTGSDTTGTGGTDVDGTMGCVASSGRGSGGPAETTEAAKSTDEATTRATQVPRQARDSFCIDTPASVIRRRQPLEAQQRRFVPEPSRVPRVRHEPPPTATERPRGVRCRRGLRLSRRHTRRRWTTPLNASYPNVSLAVGPSAGFTAKRSQWYRNAREPARCCQFD